jgi:pullulanase
VNQMDWNRKEQYSDVFQYFQKLIQLRKNHPAFRIKSAKEIQKYVNFCTQYKSGVVSYCIQGEEVGDPWEKIILIFNAQQNPVAIPLPEGTFQVVAKGNEINEAGIGEIISDEVKVEGISMSILVSSVKTEN